jgi:hypothetical protein
MRRALFFIAFACHGPSEAYQQLVPNPARASPEIQASCRLAAARCTQCHRIDRVLVLERRGFEHWERLVGRMRLMPSSGINDHDAATIVRCLEDRR